MFEDYTGFDTLHFVGNVSYLFGIINFLFVYLCDRHITIYNHESALKYLQTSVKYLKYLKYVNKIFKY